MKNLHKKISVLLLAGALLVGSSLSNGLIVYANSRSIVGSSSNRIDRRKFIGESEEFLKEYDDLMKKVPRKNIEAYKQVIEKIRKEYEELKIPKKGSYFDIRYVGLPFGDNVVERLKKKYKLSELYSSHNVVKFLYRISGRKSYMNKNYLVKIKDGGKVYNFILYPEIKEIEKK